MMIALFAMYVGAAVLAWILTAKRPEHRPVALLLSLGLAVEVLQLVLEVGVLAPLRASLGVQAPWTGWAAVVGLMAKGVWAIWPAALAATVLVAFGRKPWLAIVGWACTMIVFAVVHPIAGDGSEARVLAVVEVLFVAISAGVLVAWYSKPSRPMNSAQFALTMIVATELVSLLGAWRVGLFEQWPVSQMLYLVLFGVLILTQGRALWNSPQPCA
jgi:hypothetical protein